MAKQDFPPDIDRRRLLVSAVALAGQRKPSTAVWRPVRSISPAIGRALHLEVAMLVGVPKETKDNEYRVGIVPSTVRELAEKDHRIIVETNAGAGAGLSDADYAAAGAQIVSDREAVYLNAELIVKVKEPLATERKRLRRGQTLFAYLHLSPDRNQAEDLLNAGVTAIAYETVTGIVSTLPLLMPMSEVAGRMAPQAGPRCLEKANGGGASSSSRVSRECLRQMSWSSGAASLAPTQPSSRRAWALTLSCWIATLTHCAASPRNLEVTCGHCSPRGTLLNRRADLVIATVLIPGAVAPKLISEQIVKSMKPGSAIVDVAIDQGGCAETSRPTTHSDPTYVVNDVLHYCVTNMPGAVVRTSTFALSNATTSFVLALADKGWRTALREDANLRNRLNVHDGYITHPAVAEALGARLVCAEQVVSV